PLGAGGTPPARPCRRASGPAPTGRAARPAPAGGRRCRRAPTRRRSPPGRGTGPRRRRPWHRRRPPGRAPSSAHQASLAGHRLSVRRRSEPGGLGPGVQRTVRPVSGIVSGRAAHPRPALPTFGLVDRIDVILPVLDEAEAIPWVLSRMPEGFRPIVVDNGSSDGSGPLAASLGAHVVGESVPGFGS